MEIVFDRISAAVIREDGDPTIYGRYGESTLLRHIVRFLNERGFNVIKKLASSDGHLTDCYYIRSRRAGHGPDIYIYNPDYQVVQASRNWNERGRHEFRLVVDVFGTGQNTFALLKELCSEHAGIEWEGGDIK